MLASVTIGTLIRADLMSVPRSFGTYLGIGIVGAVLLTAAEVATKLPSLPPPGLDLDPVVLEPPPPPPPPPAVKAQLVANVGQVDTVGSGLSSVADASSVRVGLGQCPSMLGYVCYSNLASASASLAHPITDGKEVQVFYQPFNGEDRARIAVVNAAVGFPELQFLHTQTSFGEKPRFEDIEKLNAFAMLGGVFYGPSIYAPTRSVVALTPVGTTMGSASETSSWIRSIPTGEAASSVAHERRHRALRFPW